MKASFVSFLVVILAISTGVRSADVLDTPAEFTEYNDQCIKCVTSGRFYCHPTNKCYESCGGVDGTKDCTNIDNIHSLDFYDIDPINRFNNNVFNCTKNDEQIVFTDCSYTIDEEGFVVTKNQNRILINNTHHVSNYTVPSEALAALEQQFTTDVTPSYMPFKRFYQVKTGQVCQILIANTQIQDFQYIE